MEWLGLWSARRSERPILEHRRGDPGVLDASKDGGTHRRGAKSELGLEPGATSAEVVLYCHPVRYLDFGIGRLSPDISGAAARTGETLWRVFVEADD